jgi:DNA-directed RNA polymerase specialized sigma24 family protein
MPLFRLVSKRSVEAHEDIFLERFERLLTWALPLAEGEEAAAENLVHDAFVQFKQSRPDLDAIENLDASLRRMLYNLRVLQGRRAAQKRERPLCSADYDSAELSLRAKEIHAGLGAREELRLVCKYALARRVTTQRMPTVLASVPHGSLCWTQHDSESAR